ncbi:PAS domain S-box protein [Leptolinea tardivitalis]|uniref:PAS domain S-box protein n=1 Tax=Leptolinea tardivitalis TaxID=229920 RepID=UPI0007809E52|nr:HD domain-containing phosphohydrolase [Leptolinea tardivitalis]GAP20469.1 protein containing PAS domain S-box [Leptolinea tardivitalis]
MSLRTKLITLILVFILPTIGLMVIFHSRLVTAYQSQAFDFQSNSTQMVASELKVSLKNLTETMYIVLRDGIQSLKSDQCQTYLDRKVKESGLFNYLVLVDLEGRRICSSEKFDPQIDISAIPAFIESSASGSMAISQITDNQDEFDSQISIALPAWSYGPEFPKGVLIGTFSPNYLKDLFTTLHLPRTTEVYIFSTTGTVLTALSETESSTEILSNKASSFLQKQFSGKEEITLIGKDNISRVFRFAPLGLGDLALVGVGFPEGKFLADSQQFVTGNIAIISLLTLIILLLAYGGIENNVIKPLAKISQTAEAITQGKMNARTELKGQNDEIGRLGSIFDKMAESLEENRVILQKETAAKLASQEKFFRLFEDSILGIFQITKNGFIEDVNPALANMFGFTSSEEMVESYTSSAENLFENFSDSETIQELLQRRQPVKMETRFKKKDGSYFIGNLHMWGVWNAAGEMESMEGFIEDITANKQTRDQLMKLSQAVEQNPIGILISDGNGRIEYANRGIQNIFGYEPSELKNRLLVDMVPPEYDAEKVEAIRQKLRNKQTIQGEVKNKKKNGEWFWERYVISPINIPMNTVQSTLCLIEDVSEQYRNKERITQQLEELSALRTIDLAISSNLDLTATMNIISNIAVKHLKVDAVLVQLYDPDYHMLQTVLATGFEQEIPEQIPFPAAADLSDWELVEEFSVHIPENLKEKKSEHHLSFPNDDRLVACYGLPLVAKADVKGLFRVFLKDARVPEQHWLDFFYNLAAQTSIAMDNQELFRDLKQSNANLLQAYEATIEGWSRALNYRDQETEDHSIRTTRWTIDLARELGFPPEELVNIRRGALLHDIGKVSVRDSILNKPGPLTDEEWVEMRKHPQTAYDVLAPIEFLKKSLDIPYCHHERWDGSGYPRGLKGQEIPLAARIFSVIDVYDALTSDRPYRSAWPTEKVVAYLREQSGSQFDPAIVEAFLLLLEKQKVS